MKKLLAVEFNKERIYGLDILRAFAILFVMFSHGNELLPKNISKTIKIFLIDGVSIFFVLSGFLIGRIIIKTIENKGAGFNELFNFWIRRWFRTLPNYFFVLTGLIILSTIFSKSFQLAQYLNYYVFSQNLITEHPWFFQEAWSLSEEEWFYLIVPFVIFMLISFVKTTNKKAVLITALSIIVIVTFFRYYRYLQLEPVSPRDLQVLFRKQVFTRLDSLMYGILGAYLSIYHKSNWKKYRIGLFILGVVLILSTKLFQIINPDGNMGIYECVFSFSIFSLAIFLTLPFLNNIKNGKGTIFRFLTYISLISYSMYLLHHTIIRDILIKAILFPINGNFEPFSIPLAEYSLYWIFTLLFSTLLYKYFELPMMKLRDKIKISKKIELGTKS